MGKTSKPGPENNGTVSLSKYNQPAISDIPKYCLPSHVSEDIVKVFPAIRYLFSLSNISTAISSSSTSSIIVSTSAESQQNVSTLPPVQTIQDQLDYIIRFRSTIQSAPIPNELYPSILRYISTLLLSTSFGTLIGKDVLQLILNIRNQALLDTKSKDSSISSSTRISIDLFNQEFISWYTEWLSIHRTIFVTEPVISTLSVSEHFRSDESTKNATPTTIPNTIAIQGKDLIYRLMLLIDDRVPREAFMEIQPIENIKLTLDYLAQFTSNQIHFLTSSTTTTPTNTTVIPSTPAAPVTGMPNTVIELSHWIVWSVRIINTLLQTAKKLSILPCKENNYTGTFPLENVVQMCKHLLHSQVGNRDCIMTVAMLLGHALSYISRTDFIPLSLSDPSGQKTSDNDNDYRQTYIQTVVRMLVVDHTLSVPYSAPSSSWFSTLLPFQQLGFLRGILVNCPMMVLLSSFSSSSSTSISHSSSVTVSSPRISILSSVFYEFIDSCCKATDIVIRLSGIQALETILNIGIKAEQYRRKYPNEEALNFQTSTGYPTISSSTPVLTESIIERILQHLLLNWSHPNKGVANRVTEVFEDLLSYYDELSSPPSVTVAEDSTNNTMWHYNRLLPLILNQPITLLSRYGALSRLLGRMGALAILDLCPTLIQELYYAMTITADLTNTCNSFLTSFLISLRYGYEELYDLKSKVKENGSNIAWKRGVIAKLGPTTVGIPFASSTDNGKINNHNNSHKDGENSNEKSSSVITKTKREKKLSVSTTNAGNDTVGVTQLYEIIKTAGLETYLSPYLNFTGYYPYQSVPTLSSNSDFVSSPLHRNQSFATNAGIVSRSTIEELVTECIVQNRLLPEYKELVIVELCYSNSYKLWCCQWMPILITYLLHPCRDIRYKIVTHALKDIVTMDEITAYLCIKEINRYVPVQVPSIVPTSIPERFYTSSAKNTVDATVSTADSVYRYKGDDELSLVERKLYGKLYLIYHIRSNNASYCLPWDVTLHSTDSNAQPLQFPLFAPLLSHDDIRTAMMMPDLDTRILVLDVLCITTSVPSAEELNYVYEWLRMNHKVTFNESKKRILRGLSMCIQRIITGFSPSKTRDQKNITVNKAGSGSGALSYYQPCMDFFRNVSTLCIDCMYPGAVVDRIGLALEILDVLTARVPLVKDSFTLSTSLDGITSATNNVYLLSITLSRIITSTASVTVLLNGCSHTVERYRQLFSNILVRFPSNELSGYNTISSIRGLLQYALILTQSPRDREAAAGAMYLRTFYRTWILQQGYRITFRTLNDTLTEYRNGQEVDILITECVSQPPTPEDILDASTTFIRSLIALFDARMYTFRTALETLLGVNFPGSSMDYTLASTTDGYTSLFTKESMVARQLLSPLGHGLVNALRLILIEVQTLQFGSGPLTVNRTKGTETSEDSLRRSVQTAYRSIVQLLFRAVRTAQLSALRVVAGSYETDQDAGGTDAQPKLLHSPATTTTTTATSTTTMNNTNNNSEEYVLTFEGRVDCRPGVSNVTGSDETLGKSILYDDAKGTTTERGIRMPVSNSVNNLAVSTSIAMIDIHATGRNLQNSDDKRKRVADLFGTIPSEIQGTDGWKEAQNLMNQTNKETEKDEADLDEMMERMVPEGEDNEPQPEDGTMNENTTENGEIDMAHMMIVASWLLTRECAMLQGELIQRFPLPSAPAVYLREDIVDPLRNTNKLLFRTDYTETHFRDQDTDNWIISTYDIIQSGDVLLRALLTLKHIGSIYNTSEAFQMIVTKLLSISTAGTSNTPLTNTESFFSSSSLSSYGVQHRRTVVLPLISSLPSLWLERLLQRLQSSVAAQFILRRSAGFSFAFLSLLRAEPKGAPPLMLRKCLVTLLRVAGAEEKYLALDFERYLKNNTMNDTPTEERTNNHTTTFTTLYPLPSSSIFNWRSAVHALNILRLLFRDGTLGGDVHIFVSTALRTALHGFRSRAWAIRNSSMMVYATVVDRVIGSNAADKYSAKSSTSGSTGLFSSIGGSTNGLIGTNHKLGIRVSFDRERPNILQFFSRYPGLFEFIVQELQDNLNETVTNLIRSSSVSEGTTLNTTSIASSAVLLTPPPSLYPLLLLLSRMKPMLGETNLILQSDTMKLDTVRLLPIFLQCSMQRQLPIRRMAARALLSILVPSSGSKTKLIAPSTLLLPYVQTILQALGFSSTNPTVSPVHLLPNIIFSNGTTVHLSLTNSQNTRHGLLLQLDTIINACMEEYEIVRASSLDISSVIFEAYTVFTSALQMWIPGISVENKLAGLVQAALLNCVRSLESATLYILNQETSFLKSDSNDMGVLSSSDRSTNHVFRLAYGLVKKEIPSASTTESHVPLPFLLVLARRALGLHTYHPSSSLPPQPSSSVGIPTVGSLVAPNVPVNIMFGEDLFFEACGEAIVTSIMIGLYSLSSSVTENVSPETHQHIQSQIDIYSSTLQFVLAHPHVSVRISGSKAVKRCLKHAHRYIPLRLQLASVSSSMTTTKSISQLELQVRTGTSNLSFLASFTYFSLFTSFFSLGQQFFRLFIERLKEETERSVRQRLLRGFALFLSAISSEEISRYLTKHDTWITILQAYEQAKDVSSRASLITILGYFLQPFIHHFTSPQTSTLDLSVYLPYYKDRNMVDLSTVLPLCIQYIYNNSINYSNYTVRYASIRAIKVSSLVSVTLGNCVVNFIRYYRSKDSTDYVLYVYLLQHVIMKTLPLWSTLILLIDDYEDEIRECTRSTISDLFIIQEKYSQQGTIQQNGNEKRFSTLSFCRTVVLNNLPVSIRRILPLDISFRSSTFLSGGGPHGDQYNESLSQIIVYGLIGSTVQELYTYYQDILKNDSIDRTNIARNIYQQVYEYMTILSKDTVQYLENGITTLPRIQYDIQQTTEWIPWNTTTSTNSATDSSSSTVGTSSATVVPSSSLVRYPFSIFMLHRILFLPDIDNDYEEKLVTQSLAINVWKYLTLGKDRMEDRPQTMEDNDERNDIRNKDNPFATSSSSLSSLSASSEESRFIVNHALLGQLLSLSLQFIEGMNTSNSNYDLLDPILGRTVSWISGGSMDDNPELYSYARIAEALIN